MPYLDHNASSPLLPVAFEAMRPWLTTSHGNASSVHLDGQRARAAIDDARERIASRLGCGPRDLVFTSGGTESDNLALRGLFRARAPRTRIVTTAIEHLAVLDTARAIEGAEVVVVGADSSGIPVVSDFIAALGPDVALASVMLANNETGVRLPVEELSRTCRSAGIPLHVDACQAVGRVPVELSSLDADTVAISAHKLGGPQGIGALVVRGGRVVPSLTGGHQERGRRAGTENVAAIVAFAAALDARLDSLETDARRVESLRNSLESALVERIPGLVVVGRDSPRLPNTSCVCVPGAPTEALLMGLDLAGIRASGGSACTSGSLEPSHVLVAMGLEPALAKGALRFSLSPETTADDVAEVVRVLPDLAARLRARAVSPRGPGAHRPS